MRISSTVKRVGCIILVFLSGVIVASNLMDLMYECSPNDGELWKVFFSLGLACMFGFYALQDKDLEI